MKAKTPKKNTKRNLPRYRLCNYHEYLAARTRRLSFSFSGAEQGWTQATSCRQWHTERTSKTKW